MMGRTIPLSISDSEFPIPMQFPQQMPSNQWYYDMGSSYAETPASGYSNPTRYAVPVQNNRALIHNPPMLSNWVIPGDNNFLSQCKVRALQSLQRHFKPPPSLGPFQNRFSMAPENTQFPSIQAAPKPAKPVQPMHNILLSYFNYKYKLTSAVKSQQEFLNSLHLTVCKRGICKCESHRLLILHFEKCQDTSCSICGPVRLVCFPRNQNQGFSGGVDRRGYVAQESQPVCKRMRRMENSVQNDNWSLYAVTGHLSQSSEGPIHVAETDLLSSKCFDDNKKRGNENPVSPSEGIGRVFKMQKMGYGDISQGKSYDHGQEINTVVEVQDTGIAVVSQGKGCDESLNSDNHNSDCQSGKKSEDLKQTTLNEEIPCSTGDIGEHLLSTGYDLDDIWTENAFSFDEEMNNYFNELEVERMDTVEGKSNCQSLKSDGVEEMNKYLEVSDEEGMNKYLEVSDEEGMNKGLEVSDEEGMNKNLEVSDEEGMNKYLEVSDEEGMNKYLEVSDEEGMNKYLEVSDEEEMNKYLEVDRLECGAACQSGRDSEDLKVSGVSLIDFFNAEQIKEHLRSLNQHTHTHLTKGLDGDMNIRSVDENICQLCDVGGRKFCPAPMYCTCCEAQIKPGTNYYKPVEDAGTSSKHSFCTSCFRASRGGKGNISIRGLSFSKAKMEKCKHDEEVLEGWVQCDTCQSWQHMICALYNSKQDSGGDLKYVCPFCRLIEIEEKVHAPIHPAFGARDLPRTKLSDHIEERLFRSLDKERKHRAELLGKSPDGVPGAEDLTVRVVLASNKQLKVRQEFLDILRAGQTYPTEFPYKSKMLLLFQKLEGVDVCIFAMYVQEFGSECGHPNNRCIYISYLDSVKHFRPDIKTADGVALRTFVYQQILIGYLDYCKKLGFSKCYIWACPPSKGEDYILYCHPETQKTPNPHKLLQWYKKMLRKAKEESVVVEYTNFYDSFFVPSRESNITTARLPYFDGDFWSSAIGNMIRTIDEEDKESKKKMKTNTTKRALRAMGHTHGGCEDISKDMLVMQKLGQVMLPSKEEFFVVHLHFTCSNCQEPILSGRRLSCTQCTKFHLCHRCTQMGRTHTSIHGERHQLLEVRVNDVPADTEDGDFGFNNDLLNDRIDFLMFCQENHYQFDSLRRAKHSSMMMLHHLQPTTA